MGAEAQHQLGKPGQDQRCENEDTTATSSAVVISSRPPSRQATKPRISMNIPRTCRTVGDSERSRARGEVSVCLGSLQAAGVVRGVPERLRRAFLALLAMGVDFTEGVTDAGACDTERTQLDRELFGPIRV